MGLEDTGGLSGKVKCEYKVLMLQEFDLNLTASCKFLLSLLLDMEILHACPFDADVMGCVGPKSAAVAQSN